MSWKRIKNTHETKSKMSNQDTRYPNLNPFIDAVEVIHKLALVYELHLVTVRTNSMVKNTNKMLMDYFPNIFDSVIFTYNKSGEIISKADACVRINAYYLIDDNLSHAIIAAKKGMQVLLFGSLSVE